MVRTRTRKVKSTGRFGPRYGATIRKRVRKIEELSKADHRCPRCRQYTVRKQSIGIWSCRKCGYTFVGGAWQPVTDTGKRGLRITKQLAEQAAQEE